MEARWREPKREAQRLFLRRLALEAEILLERHLPRHEDEIAGSHADRAGDHCRNTELVKPRDKLQAEFEDEAIERVDVDVNTLQELIEIGLVNPIRKNLDVKLGIDLARHSGNRLGFGFADRGEIGASLAIEIRKFKS